LVIFFSVANGKSKGKSEETEQLHKDTEEKEYVAAPALIDIDLVLEKVGCLHYIREATLLG
jgi:hypothetical protein